MKPPRSRWRRPGCLVPLAGAGLFLFWLLWLWPPPIWYRWSDPNETAYMAMRRRADTTAAHERRYQPIPYQEMDPDISRAVLVAEDHRFMEHGGFDWIEVRKAVGYRRDSFEFGNAKDRRDLWGAIKAADLGEVRGASTITQQLARNLWLSPSRNPLRKVKEALAAKRLEWALPKSRILELYLNVAELGDGVWGVEAASQEYFGKSAKRLSLSEAATLAATLPHPRSSNYNYQSGRMVWKRNWILGRLGNRNAEPIRVPELRSQLPDIDIEPKVIRTDSTR